MKLSRKSLVRWLALSLGLISPNESRTLMLDVLDAMFYYHFKEYNPTSQEIIEKVSKIRKEDENPKAVSYHISQLKNRNIIDSKKRRYYFIMSGTCTSLGDSLEHYHQEKIKQIFSKIKNVTKSLERNY